MHSLKHQLYQACFSYVNNREASLESAIKGIQQSANEETKSTAGDKYETGRAMAQLEIDKHRSQLVEVTKMKQALLRIPVEENTQIIKSGSIIFTSGGNFYIAINAGQHQVEDQIFYTVSPASPIAQKLIGLRVNDRFTLNNQEITIHSIH